MNNQITNNTINNECSKCGQCCGAFIPFKKEEIKPIKEYVKRHNIKQTNRIAKDQIKVLCPFYDEQKHVCNIYPVRPYVCKDFICSRTNWRERRDYYSKISDFNGVHKNSLQLVSFDDIIYKDPSFTLNYVLSLLIDTNTNEDDKVIELFISIKRLDLLKGFSCINDMNEKLEGTQLLEQYLKNKYTYQEYMKLHPELFLNIEEE